MRVFGRRWFSVDFKSFELKEERVGRKDQVYITERRGGRSSWIRFGKEGIKILSKGVESFRKGDGKYNRGLEWRENGRRYSLELRKNAGGRFILCSVADLDGRWHCLSFPEGKGLIDGWSMLEEALLAMGTVENRGDKSKSAKPIALGKAEIDEVRKNQSHTSMVTTTHGRGSQDMLWLDISECISKEVLGSLKYGVVGEWKSQQASDPSLYELGAWAKRAWRLKGGVFFQKLSQKCFYMSFELVEEAVWVLENGSRIFRGEVMHLEWWSPATGCEGRTVQDSEVWVRIFGLPLHLWTEDILKKLGDRCGGFVVMDKETTHRKDFRWARILVKNSSLRKPSSVNLLAGARSYELQIWWEIQPRVVEVYPQVNRTKYLLNRHSVEDEGESRAKECVRETKGKILPSSRGMQWGGSQKKASLGQSVSGGGVVQQHLGVGISNEGPKKGYGPQNYMGIRESIVGETHGGERVSSKVHSGPLSRRIEAQNPCQESYVGQSPNYYKELAAPSLEEKDADNQRVKRKGLSAEKIKVKGKHSFVSLQKSAVIVGEVKGQQEEESSLMSGQKTVKLKQRGWRTEEGRSTTEIKRSQTGEKGRSSMISFRESSSGKPPRETLSSAIAVVGGIEDRFVAGEISKCTISPEYGGLNGGKDRGVHFHAGKKFKLNSCPPSIPGGTSRSLGFEIGEETGARAGRSEGIGEGRLGKYVGNRAASSGRVRRQLSMTQEQQVLGADKDHGPISGSGSTAGAGSEVGRSQESPTGLFLDGASKSPNYPNRPIPAGPIVSNLKCSKADVEGEDFGLNQTSVKSTKSPECSWVGSRDSNIGEEGNNTHGREEEVRQGQEDPHLDDERCYSIRYVDNLNDLSDLSPSSRFSVFGRPLLPGDFSGLGGTTRIENTDLMRTVGDEGRERGWDYEGVTTVRGEESEAVDRRIKKTLQEPSEPAP